MSRKNKNIVLDDHISIGEGRREALAKEALNNSSPFPSTLTYEDYDRELKKWVETELELSYGGNKLPTMVLYSNQRLSEYKQSWSFNDEKHNLILNFKTLSREFNPKPGEVNGKFINIPGDKRYTMKRVLSKDDAGREFYTVYKMKQPFGVDLVYNIGIVTNKMELINKFNEKVQDKFKALECYIRPNGHYICMKLGEISDNSEFSIDDREFYSQSYSITVLAYIITEDSFEIYEEPILKFQGVDTVISNGYKSCADIEEFDNGTACLSIKFNREGETKCKFNMDSNMLVTGISAENIASLKFEINGNEMKLSFIDGEVYTYVEYSQEGIILNKDFDNFIINKNDEIRIRKVDIGHGDVFGKILIHGKMF